MPEVKIKKLFQPIMDFLENNLNASVTDIIGSVRDLAKVKAGGGSRSVPSVLRDDQGTVVAILCSYHKKWEQVSQCEYGVKLSSGTGLNVMCKEGGARKSKQATEARNATANIVTDIQSGELALADIPTTQVAIAEARDAIIPREDGHGFVTREDVPLKSDLLTERARAEDGRAEAEVVEQQPLPESAHL